MKLIIIIILLIPALNAKSEEAFILSAVWANQENLLKYIVLTDVDTDESYNLEASALLIKKVKAGNYYLSQAQTYWNKGETMFFKKTPTTISVVPGYINYIGDLGVGISKNRYKSWPIVEFNKETIYLLMQEQPQALETLPLMWSNPGGKPMIINVDGT